MSDTPETDAAWVEQKDMVLLCRKLERERDDLMSQDYRTEGRAMRYCQERDEAMAGRDAYKQLAIKHAQERDEARNVIAGWENKWKCAVDMAARAELERDEALKCAKEYYVEFIRNVSSDNKVSKPNPLNPFYKY
jgi:hypothetical protein